MQKIVTIYHENSTFYAKVSEDTVSLLSKGYGNLEKDKNIIVYNPIEVLYLVENGMARVLLKDSEIGFNALLCKLATTDENIWRNYVIYRDLRKKNYIVKEGFGQELTFRVFDRGEFQKDVAKFLITPLMEGKNIKLSKLKYLVSVSRALNKELVISVVDRRNEVVYYIVNQVDLRNL